VFALAMQSAILMRTSTVEARVMSDRAVSEREARSAVAIVLTGLSTTVERFAAQSNSSISPIAPSAPGGGDAPPASEEEEKPRLELPQVIKDMLGDVGDKLDDEVNKAAEEERRLADGGGVTGRVRGPRGRNVIRVSGVPSIPVEVRLEPGGPVYRVSLSDAASQISLNSTSREQFMRFFEAKGVGIEVAQPLVSQILDWRDDDNFLEPGGAEQPTYDQKGVICRNAPFEAVEELLFLPIMTRELFSHIRDDLTVVATEQIHAGTASRAVLASLPGMSLEIADELIAVRATQRLTKELLDRTIPLVARDARELMNIEASSILKVRVEVEGSTSLVYEGLAVMGDKGRIRAIGLRPLL